MDNMKKVLASIVFFVSCEFIIAQPAHEHFKPTVSLITSVYKGDAFIRPFLEDIVTLKNFENYELILINANSPGNEEEVIREYLAKYPNIIYERLDHDPGVYGTWNYAIKKARAPYITNSNLDDRRNPEMLAQHVEFLENNPHIDLVYSAYFVTHNPNETFAKNNYKYVAQSEEFVPSKMYLCLPGPQPTWRKTMHEKYGYFREDMKHSGDMEFWNRAVIHGSLFSYFPGHSTLFYLNPDGLSTSKNDTVASRRLLEDLYIRGAYGVHWNGPSSSTRLLIKIPTRSRPTQFFSQLDNYYRKLSGTVAYHFLISCDEEDATMNNEGVKTRLSWYPNLTYRFGKNTSKVEAYNADLDFLKDYDVLMAVGDDMEVVVHGYDKIIVDKMVERFPDYDGVLNFHDGFVGAAVNTYPVVGKKFFNRFGTLFHPFYKSLFANEELTDVSRLMGKEAQFDDVLIRHNHPIFGLAPWDNLYIRNEGLKEYDRAIFDVRRKNNFFLKEKELFSKEWSILICTLDERENVFQLLYDNLKHQIASAGLDDKVEILFFKDNRTHTIGHKRNRLIAQSNGKYISFIDDDDLVHPHYVKMIHERLGKNPDCVSLVGIMTTHGIQPQTFVHSIDFKEKTRTPYGVIQSPPNHLNPLRRAIAAQFLFAEKNFAEDAEWSHALARSGLLKREEKIETPYYFYRYDGKYEGIRSEDTPIPQYYCTAADDKYFDYVLHLIGSIHATNFENTGEIAVANIGMNPQQLEHLKTIQKVRIFEVEKTNPQIITPFVVNASRKSVPGWYSWKPTAVKQALEFYPYVLWIDATSLVLKPVDALFKHIKQNGYFVCTIGNEIIDGTFRHPLSWCTTARVRENFNLNDPKNAWILNAEQIMTTTFGISRESASLFEPFFETSKDIALFIDDGTTPTGLGSGRHDQTLLSVIAYTQNWLVHKQDYTQQRPLSLMVNARETPFYITWHKSYIDNRTCIYNARADTLNYGHFVQDIRYKQ